MGKKHKYSLKERAAYWAGVGIAASRFKEDNLIMDNPDQKVRKSAIRGYEAVNKKDITNRVFGKGDTRVFPTAIKNENGKSVLFYKSINSK